MRIDVTTIVIFLGLLWSADIHAAALNPAGGSSTSSSSIPADHLITVYYCGVASSECQPAFEQSLATIDFSQIPATTTSIGMRIYPEKEVDPAARVVSIRFELVDDPTQLISVQANPEPFRDEQGRQFFGVIANPRQFENAVAYHLVVTSVSPTEDSSVRVQGQAQQMNGRVRMQLPPPSGGTTEAQNVFGRSVSFLLSDSVLVGNGITSQSSGGGDSEDRQFVRVSGTSNSAEGGSFCGRVDPRSSQPLSIWIISILIVLGWRSFARRRHD